MLVLRDAGQANGAAPTAFDLERQTNSEPRAPFECSLELTYAAFLFVFLPGNRGVASRLRWTYPDSVDIRLASALWGGGPKLEPPEALQIFEYVRRY